MKFVFNNERNCYAVDNYSEAKNTVLSFVKENSYEELIIQNDVDKKLIKTSRTLIRKKLTELSDLRIQINKQLLGEFNDEVKELEGILKDADKSLKAKLDDYENKLGKPKIISITIKGYNEQDIAKVVELATSLNLEVIK